MRIGLIGLGRIGAFHAETLSTLPAVSSLVVTDAVPAAIAATADRLAVETADSPAELLAAGVDGVVILLTFGTGIGNRAWVEDAVRRVEAAGGSIASPAEVRAALGR